MIMIKRTNKLTGKKQAFTLVELIVVLCILAVLAAILVPSLIGYIQKTKREKYAEEVHYALVAAQSVMTELYAVDNGEGSSSATQDGYNLRWETGKDKKWGDKILKYMDKGRGVSNGEPHIFIIGVGSSDPAANMTSNQRCTVYFVAYVADKNAPAVYYVNGKWYYSYPFTESGDKVHVIEPKDINGKNFRNTIVEDGANIPLQLIIVSNTSGLSADSGAIWQNSASGSLLSRSDGKIADKAK